jgi:hypothetical protein
MVNVSTLIYVLENLEGKNQELINLEEVHELEQKYLNRLFDLVDQNELEVSPALITKILQTASTQ